MWDACASHQRISITDVAVDLEIGVYPHERGRRQRVEIAVDLFRHGGLEGDLTLASCLDYDRIIGFLTRDLPARPHVELLEAVAATIATFCLEDGRVEACRVRLRKPEVRAAGGLPEVELYRVQNRP